ncbi:MAG: acyl carrier protein [Clostridia bacterium]|nr:acyl carrier protein [Clostridia bacterium]
MADNKIRELIAEQLNKKVEDVTDDKEIVKDLGADSLDVIEMLMSLEEEYNITVPEEDVVNIKTVGDIIKLIEAKK